MCKYHTAKDEVVTGYPQRKILNMEKESITWIPVLHVLLLMSDMFCI